jgi:hypothetical protein
MRIRWPWVTRAEFEREAAIADQWAEVMEARLAYLQGQLAELTDTPVKSDPHPFDPPLSVDDADAKTAAEDARKRAAI